MVKATYDSGIEMNPKLSKEKNCEKIIDNVGLLKKCSTRKETGFFNIEHLFSKVGQDRAKRSKTKQFSPSFPRVSQQPNGE